MGNSKRTKKAVVTGEQIASSLQAEFQKRTTNGLCPCCGKKLGDGHIYPDPEFPGICTKAFG